MVKPRKPPAPPPPDMRGELCLVLERLFAAIEIGSVGRARSAALAMVALCDRLSPRPTPKRKRPLRKAKIDPDEGGREVARFFGFAS